ncbi:unnamed protein product [Adineta ricciae]|uniref:Uncharacterized protein n=1 Tax=Adineta ricciae TaxID=249248 RepID=A0A814I1B8_ADIRI|nr:unnamed protein product [Adineta ricciae]
MHLVLFSIVAICIAVANAQKPVVAVVAAGSTAASTTVTTTGAASLPATKPAKADDDSNEDDDDHKNKSYDHEHDSHHEHDATISVDLHNVLDLFKNELHETEERIIAAIHHGHDDHGHAHHNSTAAPVLKSYRTAER